MDQAQAEIMRVTLMVNAKEDYVSFSRRWRTINEMTRTRTAPMANTVYRLTLLSFDELTGGLHGVQMIVIGARPGGR